MIVSDASSVTELWAVSGGHLGLRGPQTARVYSSAS